MLDGKTQRRKDAKTQRTVDGQPPCVIASLRRCVSLASSRPCVLPSDRHPRRRRGEPAPIAGDQHGADEVLARRDRAAEMGVLATGLTEGKVPAGREGVEAQAGTSPSVMP